MKPCLIYDMEKISNSSQIFFQLQASTSKGILSLQNRIKQSQTKLSCLIATINLYQDLWKKKKKNIHRMHKKVLKEHVDVLKLYACFLSSCVQS